jgi:hypothetical protein
MALSFYFVLGNNTISIIVADTTKAMWKSLHQEYISVPNEAGWGTIAHHFISSRTSKLHGSDREHILIHELQIKLQLHIIPLTFTHGLSQCR